CCIDARIAGRPFDTHVPAVIVVAAVLVVVAIRLVMLLAIADEIVERESVMGCDEVDRSGRCPTFTLVQVARSGDAIRKVRELPAISFPETTGGVAILAVPFGP